MILILILVFYLGFLSWFFILATLILVLLKAGLGLSRSLTSLAVVIITIIAIVMIIITRPWPAGQDGIVAGIQLHSARFRSVKQGKLQNLLNLSTRQPYNFLT